MRWVFTLLLIGNGIYYFFHNYMQQPVVRERVAVAATADLGQPVVLLSELTQEQGDMVESIAIPVSIEVQEPDPMCWMLGGFKEQVSAKQVKGRLEALDIHFELQDFDVVGRSDYWVHVPPQPTRKLAISILRDLQLKKIDSFLITDGELANGVSLGLFTEQPRAENLYNIRKKQGIEVALKEVPRIYTETWLVSVQGEYDKFSDALWAKIKEGQQGIERRKNYCNKIASPENLD